MEDETLFDRLLGIGQYPLNVYSVCSSLIDYHHGIRTASDIKTSLYVSDAQWTDLLAFFAKFAGKDLTKAMAHTSMLVLELQFVRRFREAEEPEVAARWTSAGCTTWDEFLARIDARIAKGIYDIL